MKVMVNYVGGNTGGDQALQSTLYQNIKKLWELKKKT